MARDKALNRLERGVGTSAKKAKTAKRAGKVAGMRKEPAEPARQRTNKGQLAFGDL